MQDRYYKKYNIKCDFNSLSDIILYSKIEKRGFLIKKGGMEICRKKLDGGIKININLID